MRASPFLLAGLLVLPTFGAAQAQQPYGSNGYNRAPPPPSSSDYDTGRNASSGQGYAEQESEGPPPDLMRELNLRPGQSAALADYKAAFQPDAGREARDRADAARLPGMTTPARLDFAARQMDVDRQDFERTAAATRRFYAQLSSTQKAAFDRLTAPQADQDDDEDAPPAPRPDRR